MKLLIASDIHGDYNSARRLFDIFDSEGCDRVVILGDILYHGPRNDLPCGYNPKKVIELLNSRKDSILAVRGNCDTEVDQMVLEFPILGDYALFEINGLSIFATHGHKFNTETPPALKPCDILLHGHTHLVGFTDFGCDNCYINPGSVSIPKDNNPKTYMILEDKTFYVYDLDGNMINKRSF